MTDGLQRVSSKGSTNVWEGKNTADFTAERLPFSAAKLHFSFQNGRYREQGVHRDGN